MMNKLRNGDFQMQQAWRILSVTGGEKEGGILTNVHLTT